MRVSSQNLLLFSSFESRGDARSMCCALCPFAQGLCKLLTGNLIPTLAFSAFFLESLIERRKKDRDGEEGEGRKDYEQDGRDGCSRHSQAQCSFYFGLAWLATVSSTATRLLFGRILIAFFVIRLYKCDQNRRRRRQNQGNLGGRGAFPALSLHLPQKSCILHFLCSVYFLRGTYQIEMRLDRIQFRFWNSDNLILLLLLVSTRKKRRSKTFMQVRRKNACSIFS